MSARQRYVGFTLIELLAGMAVLTILVLLLTRVFSESTRLMLQGTKRLENVIAGRSSMFYMAREVSGALVDSVLSMSLISNKDAMLGNSSEKADRLYFCTAQGRPDASGERQVRQIMYRTLEMRDSKGVILPNRMRVVTYENFQDDNTSYRCYEDPLWWTDLNNKTWTASSDLITLRTIAENVSTFDVYVYDENGDSVDNYGPGSAARAAFVDLYFETLGEKDSIRAASLPQGAARDNFVSANARRYFQRVYLNNFVGYNAD